MRGIRTIIAGLVLAASAGAPMAHAGTYFSPTGPWNAPVPANPALDPNSAAIASMVSSTVASKISQSGTYPYINTDAYSSPIYFVNASTPKLPLKIDPGNAGQQPLINAINGNGGVPFPPNAQPAPGTDGTIIVYDRDRHVVYDFWHASSPHMNSPGCVLLPWNNRPCYLDSKWHADWGGIMDDVDTDPGFFSVNSWPGLTGTQGYSWGASATSLPFLAGLITIDDLRSGVIDHALAGAFMNSCSAYWTAPAQRHDGTDTAANCLPEGAKLQLDPSYDVNADSNPPITKAIERAAQTYGIIIRDNAGGSFTFYGQDPQTEPPNQNPYITGPGVGGVDNGGHGFFGGLYAWQLFGNFPWSRLRVIASPHCTAAPCG